jgi:hypothetical protein
MNVGSEQDAIARIVAVMVAAGVGDQVRRFEDFSGATTGDYASFSVASHHGLSEWALICALLDKPHDPLPFGRNLAGIWGGRRRRRCQGLARRGIPSRIAANRIINVLRVFVRNPAKSYARSRSENIVEDVARGRKASGSASVDGGCEKQIYVARRDR